MSMTLSPLTQAQLNTFHGVLLERRAPVGESERPPYMCRIRAEAGSRLPSGNKTAVGWGRSFEEAAILAMRNAKRRPRGSGGRGKHEDTAHGLRLAGRDGA